MGFNKRYVSKEGILSNTKNIDKYLHADALIITDDWSRRFINDLNRSERSLRSELHADTIFWSGSFNRHPNYSKLHSLSETLLSLMNNPMWSDIDLTVEKLNIEISPEEAGRYDLLASRCIHELINYYDQKTPPEIREEKIDSIIK